MMRIGFSLFMPQKTGNGLALAGGGDVDIAFVPLAMPLMCGPGAIATIIGMAATIGDCRGNPFIRRHCGGDFRDNVRHLSLSRQCGRDPSAR